MDDVYRNIVSLRTSTDLFSNLNDGNEADSRVAVEAEMRVKADMPLGKINRGFHYTTAIAYPFETESYLSTRYGNGSYGVWYGSLDMETTIHETAYHAIKDLRRIDKISGTIIRHRAVYEVSCQAILFDLRKKGTAFPDLIANDYGYTQMIGSRLHKEGHPGLLAPSARCSGSNIVAFTPEILRNPKFLCNLTYRCRPIEGIVIVERKPGEKIHTLRFD